MNEKKSCAICSGTEWTDVDHLRAKPEGMIICNGCGFITFERFDSHEEYEAYYDTDYRSSKVVHFGNLVTTNRKLGYHESFLGKMLRDRKDMRICDIGSGIGYFLKWCRDNYGHKRISGVELTGVYRRYAENAFDIKTSTKFDPSQKYDLVACYHTLEHIPDPMGLLSQVREAMAGGGRFYVATPVWMEEFMKFGGGVFGTEGHPFDEHFHPDHVNAWSRWHLHELLSRAGWEIEREDRAMYGTTLLLKPCEPREYRKPQVGALSESPPKFPWKDVPSDVITQLSDMKRSATALSKGQMSEALRLYPQNVDAALGEIGAAFKDYVRQTQMCDMAEKLCPNTMVFNMQRGLLFYQRGRLDDAEREFIKVLEKKPHDDNALMHMAMICLRRGESALKTDYKSAKAEMQKGVAILDLIANINPALHAECFNHSAYAMSVCPTDAEMAVSMNGGGKFSCPHDDDAPHIGEEELAEKAK